MTWFSQESVRFSTVDSFGLRGNRQERDGTKEMRTSVI